MFKDKASASTSSEFPTWKLQVFRYWGCQVIELPFIATVTFNNE